MAHCRKAFRLGKFLKDVDSLRKSRATGYLYLLEALAYGGEGVLAKAGVLSAEQEKQLAYLSVWWEFIGYTGSISLSLIKLRELSYKEAILHASFEQKRVQQGVLDMSLNRQLASVRALKALRTAAIVQDIADAAIAINDILGGDLPMLGHPVTLALAGLLSGSISAHKNWNA
eukprot:357281-Chlamydomonas_euryale.AAC.19